jgi:quercetin dioxygenase-like cupin family protein
MPSARPFLCLCLLAALLLPAVSRAVEADSKGFIRELPGQVEWKDVPNGRGVQMAVISGDPTKPGIYVIRVKFPPGVMSSPHYHREDRHAVVLKGTWYTGTDENWDPATTVGLPAGSYMKHPAGAVHFDGAKDEEVIVQIIGEGPTSTTVLYPKEGDFGTAHKLK